jgi:hypothetical protein
MLRTIADKGYEIMPLVKKQWVKAARVVLCLAALVATQGCTTPQNHATGKPWSQIAAEEEREQQLRASPHGDWDFLP